MKLKALFEDDGAVSPVIGVILMVAITVILAAVIGTFVLGLGDRVSQAQPSANFAFEYTDSSNDKITISHNGGAGVEASQLNVQVGGADLWNVSDGFGYAVTGTAWSNKITAGDSLEIEEDGSDDSVIKDGKSVKVIWSASGSDKTAVIGESEVSL